MCRVQILRGPEGDPYATIAPTWVSPSQIAKYSGRLPIMSAIVCPLVTPPLSARREYWFIRASSARKLKRSRSPTSAGASSYLRAHSVTARGRMRSASASPGLWSQSAQPSPSG